jgi:hypothetical protein
MKGAGAYRFLISCQRHAHQRPSVNLPVKQCVADVERALAGTAIGDDGADLRECRFEQFRNRHCCIAQGGQTTVPLLGKRNRRETCRHWVVKLTPQVQQQPDQALLQLHRRF